MAQIPDLRSMHRGALAELERVIVKADVTAADMERRTPCTEWNLGTLLGHVIGQNYGFAEAIEAADAPVTAFAIRPCDADTVVRDVHKSNLRLIDACTNAPPNREVHLAEIRGGARFPVAAAVGFQLLDTVIHTWDIASSLGAEFRPDDDVIAVVGRIAERVPDGESRQSPNATFAPGLAPLPDDPWARALARLGRDIHWK